MAESVSRRRLLPFGCGVLLMFGCTACGGMENKTPDRVLFQRGVAAGDQQKSDVACLTLRALVNTYPESEYVDPAKQVMEQQKCRDGSNNDEFSSSGLTRF